MPEATESTTWPTDAEVDEMLVKNGLSTAYGVRWSWRAPGSPVNVGVWLTGRTAKGKRVQVNLDEKSLVLLIEVMSTENKRLVLDALLSADKTR